ncbi:MAG TPA: ATPase, T2SS/T4P/T4SS family [Atribacteraceae bacterium]|nr:ATPase, T2SS/T4P/T4SS family [Atribacteraceae bacterium]
MKRNILNSNRLGEVLLAKGKVTPEQIREAIEEQGRSHLRLGDILRKKGLITEKDLSQALADQDGTPFIDLDNYVIDPKVVVKLSEKFCREHTVVPVAEEGGSIILAMANPVDIVAIDRTRLMTKMEVRPYVATREDINRIINAYYGAGESVNEVLREAEDEVSLFLLDEGEEIKVDKLKAISEEAPIVRVVNMVILQAVRSGASDIHIEPQETKVKIRYRIDGILQDSTTTSVRIHPALASRIKILSRMNIAERRLPQDGRFQVTVDNRSIDFRVSSLPTIFGEKIVMRILDKSSLLLDLDRLGFEDQDLEVFYRMIQHPYGMVLLTGPTGSGKTTTLYSALNFINKPILNILTIEDPVEYRLEGINQVQVKPKIGLSFANTLRSIMRQDPDVIMIGEIRDQETAEIAIHAALTGHLVYSTLHTNTAAGAIVRLQEMGVPPYLISSSLVGVVAQRLVRRICEHCKIETPAMGSVARELSGGTQDIVTIYRGKGCSRCSTTGYRGRTSICEVFSMTDSLRKLVLALATEKALTEEARKNGMATLRESALKKVLAGATTLEEVYRVTTHL